MALLLIVTLAGTSILRYFDTSEHSMPRLDLGWFMTRCIDPCSTQDVNNNADNSDKRRTSKPFEIIYSDLSGIAPVPSLAEDAYYYITFIDDYTRLTWIIFLKNKHAAENAIRGFVALVQRQFDKKIKRVFTDNGTEYVNQSVTQYFLEKGIIHDLMPAHCHEYNGIAERYNRTLMTMVRMMLLQQSEDIDIEKLDKRLWAEACHTAVYIKNRLSHSALSGMTPFEAMFGRKPQLAYMRPVTSIYLRRKDLLGVN